jgi:hypothetical protein
MFLQLILENIGPWLFFGPQMKLTQIREPPRIPGSALCLTLEKRTPKSSDSTQPAFELPPSGILTESEIKWKQNGNKQPLSYAPGPPQVAPGFAVFCFVSPFAWRSRWRVPPLHSTQSRAQNKGPNFVSKWKQVRYNEGPQRQPPPLRGHMSATPHTQAGAGSRAGNRYTACTHTQAAQNGPARKTPGADFGLPSPSQTNLFFPSGDENDVKHLFVADNTCGIMFPSSVNPHFGPIPPPAP